MRGNGWSRLSFLNPFQGNERRQQGKSSSSRVRPQVEALEDRWVPSMLDLTTAGATGTVNGAIFEQADPQPTGCGVIHDFLRIQSHGPGATVEQGYNTDARPLQFDEKTSQTFTHSIQLSDLPTVTVGGQTYAVILLGVNQDQSSPLISLDGLRIYVSDSSALTGYDPATQQLAGLNAVYDMGASNWVKLDSSLSHGNGSGDMFLFVPVSDFQSGGTSSNPYVYLYSEFGVNFASNGGFEQWAPASAITLPTAVSGFVLVNQNGTNTPLSNVQLTLTGTTTSGQTVTMTTVTDANGAYSFVGLAPGTYTITETQPPGFAGVVDSVGTVNGVIDGTTAPGLLTGNGVISSIVLLPGNQGINYNFIEQPPSGGTS